jgi:hypothetical protein
VTLRAVTPDERPFRKDGLGYTFAPAGAPVVLRFSRFKDSGDELTAEVQVLRPDGQHVMRRRLNLMASGARGGVSTLAADLKKEVDIDWTPILRDGCESVIAAERTGRPMQVVSGRLQRPPPPAWLCDGLVLESKLNCWLGAGSTGKSTLAKALCAYYAAGFKFLGRETMQGRPLYLDWEDDQADFERVVADVCKNLGLAELPWMAYRSMRGLRLRDALESLVDDIERCNIGLVVIDAISAAGGSWGEHTSWESVALDLEATLGQMPTVTVLALDHVNADDHKNNGNVPSKARGAERKYEVYRNQWSLVADLDMRRLKRHVVGWYHTKLNAGVYRDPFVTEIVHRENELAINELGMGQSPGTEERLGERERLVRHVLSQPGQSIKDIALAVKGSDSKATVDNARNQLIRSEKHGEVRRDAGGLWWPPDHLDIPSHVQDSLTESAYTQPVEEGPWWVEKG